MEKYDNNEKIEERKTTRKIRRENNSLKEYIERN